jgi:hypothetical protein
MCAVDREISSGLGLLRCLAKRGVLAMLGLTCVAPSVGKTFLSARATEVALKIKAIAIMFLSMTRPQGLSDCRANSPTGPQFRDQALILWRNPPGGGDPGGPFDRRRGSEGGRRKKAASGVPPEDRQDVE